MGLQSTYKRKISCNEDLFVFQIIKTRRPLQKILLEDVDFMSQRSGFVKEFASISSFEKRMIVKGLEGPGNTLFDISTHIFNNSSII